MKTANITPFIGVLICSLLSGRAPLHAQPAPASPPATSPPATSPPSTSPPAASPPATSSPAASPPATSPPATSSPTTSPPSTSPPSTSPPSTSPPTTDAPTAGYFIAVEGGDDRPWNRGVPSSTRRAARELFLEGNRLFNIPLFVQAAQQYTAALAKWKHPAFYFNLAIAQLNLGQEVEAHENLQLAIQQGAEPIGAEQFQEAQKQLQDLERQLGRIHVTCPTPGAEITLDGAPLFTGSGSHETWVKAKGHDLVVKKPGYLAHEKHVVVAPGKRETVDLHLRELVKVRRFATWKPWAVVGTGLAIVAAGGAVHAISARKFNDYDTKFLELPCSNSPGCFEDTDIRPTLRAELTRARLEQKIAVGGYIAGGALLAAGVVLSYLNQPYLVEREVTDSPAGGVAVVPTVSPDMLGVLVTVSH